MYTKIELMQALYKKRFLTVHNCKGQTGIISKVQSHSWWNCVHIPGCCDIQIQKSSLASKPTLPDHHCALSALTFMV